MSERRPMIAGNWKMHGDKAMVGSLLQAVNASSAANPGVDVAVFVPSVFLAQAEQALAGSSVDYGAQNIYPADQGAFTGAISAPMLNEFGAQMVLAGHSERRQLFGESSIFVADQCFAAHAAGLTPILCVGETQAEREAGQTEQVIASQLEAVIGRDGALEVLQQAVIAYEPVWAIGTGLTATPAQAQSVHAAIRAQLANLDKTLAESMRILYGGSVKPDNVAGLVSQPDIDGGLVGGAALDAEQFNEIIAQCTNCY